MAYQPSGLPDRLTQYEQADLAITQEKNYLVAWFQV